MDIDEAIEAQLTVSPQYTAAEVMALLPSTTEIPAIFEITPAQRLELVRAHEVLERVEKAVRARRESIELAFKRAAVAHKTDQIKLAGGGTVRIVKGQSHYETKGEAIREKLLKLMAKDGNLTQQEIDAAVPTIITVKPNHTKLNYLANHRGEAVAHVIDSNRKRVEAEPLSAKVEFHPSGGLR